MSNSLREKTVGGLSWSMIDNIANQGIVFLVGIVLANLLSPQEYGLIGIVTVFLAVFNSLVDSGFSNALVQKHTADDKDYNTVFIFNLLFSVILYVLLFFSAPYVALFFKQPELVALLRVVGIIIIVNALSLVQKTILVKRIDFKTQTKISLISSISSGVIGISMAFLDFGVWSLAAQQISRQLLYTLFLWIFNKTWHLKWEFSKSRFHGLFGYGYKIMIIGLISTIWEEVYQVVIGRVYSTEVLGQFTRANQFRNIFSRNISTVLQRVTFPVLSSVQDDHERLRALFIRIVKSSVLLTSLCMFGMIAVAKPMILCLIGRKWLPAVLFLQIISLSGLCNPISNLNVNILQVLGKSGLLLKIEIPKRLIIVIPVLLGIFGNIYWMLGGSVVINVCCYLINAYFAGREIGYPLHRQLRDILPSLGVAALMAAVVLPLSFLPLSPYLLFPLQIVVGVSFTIGICEILKREEYLEIKRSVLEYVRKIKK